MLHGRVPVKKVLPILEDMDSIVPVQNRSSNGVYMSSQFLARYKASQLES
jgi:hypothetical protein